MRIKRIKGILGNKSLFKGRLECTGARSSGLRRCAAGPVRYQLPARGHHSDCDVTRNPPIATTRHIHLSQSEAAHGDLPYCHKDGKLLLPPQRLPPLGSHGDRTPTNFSSYFVSVHEQPRPLVIPLTR